MYVHPALAHLVFPLLVWSAAGDGLTLHSVWCVLYSNVIIVIIINNAEIRV